MSGSRPASLPPAATRRIDAARQSGIWSSQVKVGDETALRSVGFEPVGVVTSSIPSSPFSYRFPAGLGARFGTPPGTSSWNRVGYGGYQPLDDPLAAQRAGGFGRDYVEGPAGGILPDLGWSWQRVIHEMQERQLFDAAIAALRKEAQGLGAHGIVDIRVRRVPRPQLAYGNLPVHEIQAVGLGVRAGNSAPGGTLFTATVSGSDVAQLLWAGLAPSQAVFGVGIVKADMGNRTRKRLRSMDPGEVAQFSEAVYQALTLAAKDLERTAAAHGDLCVGCHPQLDFEHSAGAGLEALARITGTAVRRFSVPPTPDVLSILRLEDRSPEE